MKKLLLVISIILSTSLSANEIKPYTESLFNQLNEKGVSMLIDIKAEWCSTCKKQSKVIKKYLDSKQNEELIILEVNYDNQKEVVRKFKAPRQSTLVLFKDGKEIGKVIAEANEDKLFTFFNKAK
jgi:thioredoxin 1